MACYLKSSYRPTKTTRIPAKKENQGNCDAAVQLILKMGTEEKIPYGWILLQVQDLCGFGSKARKNPLNPVGE